MKKYCACLVAAVSVLASTPIRASDREGESTIRVQITGLRNERGQVICALFASAEDFPKRYDRAVARAIAKIDAGHATCEFEAPPGTYAVSALHDENSNGKLDTNWLGIPREGVGASNDPNLGWDRRNLQQRSFRIRNDRRISTSSSTTFR